MKGTLFIAGRSPADWRRWAPLGRLDLDLDQPWFRFQHVRGSERAEDIGLWVPVSGFGEVRRVYESRHLFPVFENRVMNRRRPDLADYLRSMDLPPSTDPIHGLWVSGGYRVTDWFNVFPKLTRDADGAFRCRFFVHRVRELDSDVRRRIKTLEPGETVHLVSDAPGSPTVAIYTGDRERLGWTPMFLASEIALARPSARYEARVVRVNPAPCPSSDRVLIETACFWENHEPMSGEDFQPLAERCASPEPLGPRAGPTRSMPHRVGAPHGDAAAQLNRPAGSIPMRLR